jgi:hypothetical protein
VALGFQVQPLLFALDLFETSSRVAGVSPKQCLTEETGSMLTRS